MSGPGLYLFGDEEKKEIADVIAHGRLSRYGDASDPGYQHKVISFEKEFAEFMGAKYCVALSSGTGALMTCFAALGIGPGDEVIVPGYNFIASLSSGIMMNAIPVLAEVDESLTIDPTKIEKLITKRTKAIMPVHMLGNPCDMDPIMKIAEKYNLYVIEDCCQAVGGEYKGRRLGTFGHISAYSFNVNKTITTGDGGAVVTNDEELYKRAFAFHDQGHMPLRMGIEIGNRSLIGINMRISELTGAVGLAQTRKLQYILDTLRTKKKKLKDQLCNVDGLSFRRINDHAGECATLMTLLFEDEKTARRFAEKIDTVPIIDSGWHVYRNMEQIMSQQTTSDKKCPFACPLYGEPVKYYKGMLPQTDDILSRAVSISVGVVDRGLGAPYGINILSDDAEIDRIASEIQAIMKEII